MSFAKRLLPHFDHFCGILQGGGGAAGHGRHLRLSSADRRPVRLPVGQQFTISSPQEVQSKTLTAPRPVLGATSPPPLTLSSLSAG